MGGKKKKSGSGPLSISKDQSLQDMKLIPMHSFGGCVWAGKLPCDPYG